MWSSVADTSMELYEHTDWYQLCVEMHVWQEAVAIRSKCFFVKIKKYIQCVGHVVNGFWYFNDMHI